MPETKYPAPPAPTIPIVLCNHFGVCRGGGVPHPLWGRGVTKIGPRPHNLTTPPPTFETSHAFVDNLFFGPQNPLRIQEILNIFDTTTKQWAPDINLTKTKVHVMGTPPPKKRSALLAACLSPKSTQKPDTQHINI